MSDLFISYARDDNDFVQKLHAVFEAGGQDAWLDCFDIPKGEKFWDEITQGIDGANAFVFIISPSSVDKASWLGNGAYCRREIEHAARGNKRIIPIVYQEGFNLNQEILAHQVLGERNWIFFTPQYDFETQFQELLRTLKTDIAYVKKHTELTLAAEIWDKRGRKDRSTLWHGKRLVEAEKWLRRGEAKSLENTKLKYPDPTPTSLQKIFIIESQKYAKFRRIVMASLVLIPLFVIEPYQREQAVKQDFDRLSSTNQIDKRQAVVNLVKGCWELREWRKELLPIGERIHGNCRSLSNSNLDNINFSGISPGGGYTEGVDLRNVELDGSTLRNAILSGIEFNHASFYGANLQGANLSRSILNNSFLNGANLSGSDLSSANLRDSKLSAIFADANLSWANLKNSNLAMARLNNASLYYADLSDTNLYGTTFDGADLSNTNMNNAKELTLEQVKLAKLCKTKLPPDLKINPDRDCSVKPSSQFSLRQSIESSSKQEEESTDSSPSRSVYATDSFTPRNNCQSSVQKKGRCRITRTYKDGKWSGVTISWSDDVETNIVIETVNAGNRITSTHGKARVDGKLAEYSTFSDGGICFRVLEDNSTLCYR